METSSEMETPAVFRRRRNLQLVSERAETAQPSQSSKDLQKREEALQMVMATITVALGILSQRLMTVLALMASSGMFAWSVFEPTGWRLSAAIAFAVCVLLPLAYLDWATRRP